MLEAAILKRFRFHPNRFRFHRFRFQSLHFENHDLKQGCGVGEKLCNSDSDSWSRMLKNATPTPEGQCFQVKKL